MKILKKTKLFFVLAAVIFSLDSCVKSEIQLAQNYNLTSQASEANAILTDMGPINDSCRKLMLILKGLKYELTNNYGTFLQTGSVIQAGLYSDMDGSIPSGIYNHSDSIVNTPFKFNDAFLSISGNYIRISSGSITVDSSEPNYRLVFNCGLSDGEAFSATFYGALRYTDAY